MGTEVRGLEDLTLTRRAASMMNSLAVSQSGRSRCGLVACAPLPSLAASSGLGAEATSSMSA